MALWTFRRFSQFFGRELESASSTARRFHKGLVLGMFEAFEKMIQIVSDLARRFFNKTCDLAHGHRISIQQAIHTEARQDPRQRNRVRDHDRAERL